MERGSLNALDANSVIDKGKTKDLEGGASCSAEVIVDRCIDVMFICGEWGSSKGGLSTFNRELALNLAKYSKERIRVHCFACQSTEEERKDASSNGIHLIRAQRPPGSSDPLEWIRFPPSELPNPDIIVGHGRKFGGAAYSIRRITGCKWIHFVHVFCEDLGKYKLEWSVTADAIADNEAKNKRELELCKEFDLVVAVGSLLQGKYQRSLPDFKVEVITPGIFEKYVNPTARKSNKFESSGEDEFRIFMFGRGSFEDFELKGYDIIGKAVASLERKFELTFVGAPQDQQRKIEKWFLEETKITRNQLTIRGFCNYEEVREMFRQADVVVMPSRTEGFGLVALEAISAGVPLLVSGECGIAKALQTVDGGMAVVISSASPEEWANRIQELSQQSPDERYASAVCLRENYGKRYHWKEESEQFMKVILQLAPNPSPKETVITGKVPCSSNNKEQTQRKEILTAKGNLLHGLEVGKRDGREQSESAPEKAPNTSLEKKRTDGNEQTKPVQDSSRAPRDSTEEVRAATSMALEGAAGYVSTKKTQRNTKEVWTATERAPNTSLRRRRTDGNEQTKSVQDSGIAPRDSTEEELKNKKEVSAATCTAVEGAAAYDSAEQAERNTKEVGTAAGSAVEGATPYDSAEQAQRNTREVWTATAHEKQEVPYYTSGKGLADGEDATVDTEGNQKTLIKSGKIGDKEDTWHLREAGASIKLNSGAVQLPLPFTCRCLLWNPKTLSPPTASDEILVSSVIELSHDGPPDLDYGESIEGLSFTVALLHSAPDLEGYEVVIKQLTDLENNEWKELKTENTWHGSETSTVPKWLFPFAQAVCAKSAVSSFAAIWRPKSFTFSRGTAVGPELTCIVPDFPDVSVQIPQSCVPVNQDFSVTIKVQEFPSSELKEEEGLVGPGLYISGSQNVNLVAPVTIRIPLTLRKEKQELAELCPGELRILHCESLVELLDWKDITDQLDEPPRLLDGIVQFKVRHFSGLRPIKLIGSLLQSASGLIELVRRLSSSSRPQYARFSTCLCETSVDGHFGLKLFCYPQKLQYDVNRQISSCIAPQKCEGSSRKPVCVEEKILVFLSEAIIPQGTDEKNALQFVRFLENEVFYSGGEVCLKSGSVPKVKFKDQSQDLLCNLPIGKASPVPVPVTFDHKEGNDIPMVKDGEPTDLELEYLSLELAEKWETLARRLEVNPAAITDFGKPNEGLAAKAFKILLAWKQKEGSKATYKALYDALCHELVECRRQAEKFCCERL